MTFRVTIACPEALIEDANQLASCLGYCPDDALTYGAPIWLDAAGNRYSVASTLVGPDFVAAAGSPLKEPAWGANMDAAAIAQAAIRIGNPEAPKTCRAAPDALVAVFGDDQWTALALMGLTREATPEI